MAWATVDPDGIVLEVSFSKPDIYGTDYATIEIADAKAISILQGKIALHNCFTESEYVPSTWWSTRYPTMMPDRDVEVLAALAKNIAHDGIAVEIGSRIGGSAKVILDHAPAIKRMYCLDVEWKYQDGAGFDDVWMKDLLLHWGIDGVDTCLAYAQQLLSGYNNVRLLPLDSPYEHPWWMEQIDFFFEDSQHANPQLRDSLEFWTQLVKPGGIISGHDYVSSDFPEVKIEVDRLAESLGARLIVESNVWWMIKPKSNQLSKITISKDSQSRSYWRDLHQDLDQDLLQDKHLFIWDWRHSLPTEINQKFPWPELSECIGKNPDSEIAVIIDSNLECPDYANHLSQVCDSLIAHGIKPRNILLWGNCQEDSSIPVSWTYSRGGWSIGMNLHEQVADPQTKHHFIMLAKQPRPLRLLMACEIMRRQLDSYGNLSCGSVESDYHFAYNEQWHGQFIDPEFKQRFPILLDGPIPQTSKQQYQTTDPRIRQACINVICESSQDPGIDDSMWTKPWVTEKTSKALLLCQLPLMVSVPGSVKNLRTHGIDMFDDIIDHSYDSEQDLRRRISMIADQLEQLCKQHNPSELRAHCWPRLLKNREVALEMIGIEKLRLYQQQQLTKWLQDIQRNLSEFNAIFLEITG